MEYIEFYFLNYKYTIFAETILLDKLREFWKGFLKKEKDYDDFIEWEIIFIQDKNAGTYINYEKKIIEHRYDSVCDLTEFNNMFREVIVKLSAMDGIVWLHCSAFEFKDKTTLVVGKKGDGKTTVLLNAIKNLEAKFIGNDQMPVFIKNKEIYCYSWRPDIKICTNDSNHLNKNAKILHLVNNNIPYTFIDYKNMSKRLKKDIIPPNCDLKIKCVEKNIKKIDYIFLLYNQSDIKELKNTSILEYIIDDPETILEFKLKDLNRYMPYWNKRIVNVKVKKDAANINNKIISYIDKKCKIFLMGNRIEFSKFKRFINILIKNEKGVSNGK